MTAVANRSAVARGVSRAVSQLIISAASCVMIYVGAKEVLHQQLTTGQFSTFVLFAAKVNTDLEDIFALYASLQAVS